MTWKQCMLNTGPMVFENPQTVPQCNIKLKLAQYSPQLSSELLLY